MERLCWNRTCHWNSRACVLWTRSARSYGRRRYRSDPWSLAAWFASLGVEVRRIGLEAGPLSQWLFAGMAEAGLAVELLETRHVRNAFKTMPVKTDRKDARGIAELIRLGWFRPVHCQVRWDSQETRAILTARTLVQSLSRHRDEPARHFTRFRCRSVGKTTSNRFAGRIRDLVDTHPSLQVIAEALLAVHEVLLREVKGFEKGADHGARQRPGSAVDDDHRRWRGRVAHLCVSDRRSRAVQIIKDRRGVTGMTPKKYQLARIDITGRISKIGDKSVRTALYQAAHVILTQPVKSSALMIWARRLAKRIGTRSRSPASWP